MSKSDGSPMRPSPAPSRRALGICLLLMASAALHASAAGIAMEERSIRYLKALSLEDLAETQVVSVSKIPQKLSDAPAAVFVVTREDIRRSGARSIPEALRLVPGVEAARIDANKWAVTIRGFNMIFANKLLVLIDGRSIYTPLYSGVYWEVQDLLLDDVDRIEVIRGPGAAIWGANAVNGVVNIITRPAGQTQGGLVKSGTGTDDRAVGAARYGGAMGDGAHYRIFAKYTERDGMVNLGGGEGADDSDALRGGFRLDWRPDGRDKATISGEIYGADIGERLFLSGFTTPPFERKVDTIADAEGGHLLGRWSRTFSDDADLTLLAYYDAARREDILLGQSTDTIDLELRHRFSLGERQEIVWGIGYRRYRDDVDGTFFVEIHPESTEDDLFTLFFQDTFSLMPDRLRLILGARFEHNEFTGLEAQPNLRLLWKPGGSGEDRHTLWAAVSRAVRTPSRSDHGLQANLVRIPLPEGGINRITVLGDDDFTSEDLTAWEAGYRIQPRDWLSVDMAAFFNRYDDLRTIEPGAPFPDPAAPAGRLVTPLWIDNRMSGEIYGAEMAVHFQPRPWWSLFAGYAWTEIDLDLDPDSGDIRSEAQADRSPGHTAQLRSYLDLPHDLEMDTALFFVDGLPDFHLSAHTRLDLRLGWHPSERLSFSLKGENLLDDRHPEFGTLEGTVAAEIEQSLYGEVVWRF